MIKKKDSLVEKERNRQDLGFGTKMTDRQTRLITGNGLFNVRRVGQSFEAWLNLYNRLITIRWSTFIAMHLVGVNMSNPVSQFWDAFFFSAQSLTTVGYGRIAPVGFTASFVAAFEALS
eukprot:gene22292-42554_t